MNLRYSITNEGSELITSQETASYRQQLQDLRSALLAQIADQRGGSRSRAEVAAEHFMQTEDSRAQVSTARELEFAINEHGTAELAALDAALGRLDAGTFGQCTDCGGAIARARLRAMPEAPRCLSCQAKTELPHH
jgi:DnaK suppressor protein